MLIKTKQLILIIVAVLILFPYCKKNKWKQPTDVTFIMDFNRSSGHGGKLVFTNGNINLANFSFDGKRVQGDDVYFTNPFSSGLNINFDQNLPVESLNFDIPQGTYTKIEISFETFGTNGDNQIFLEGNYKKSNNNNYALRFEFKAKILQTVIAKKSSGSSEIVLNKDVPSYPKIIFDPIFWFNPVSPNLINNSEIINIGGTPTILINDTCNENIYNIIVDRINNGTSITFD